MVYPKASLFREKSSERISKQPRIPLVPPKLARVSESNQDTAIPDLKPLYLTLAVVAMANTILASALPTVSADLSGARDYTAIVTAYVLPKALATPVGGRLVDAWRPKRVVAGFGWLYLLATALCGMVENIDQLLLLRVLQGLTGGGLLASVYVVIDLLVPPRFQGRVQGRISLVLGASAAAAPLLGGLITEYFGWRWCFFLNIPPLILGMLSLRKLPELAPKGKLSVDWKGMLCLILVSSPLLLATTWGGARYPWTSPLILGLFATSAVACILFWIVERLPEEPLFDPALASDPVIGWSFVACFCTGGAFFGSLLFLPQFMVSVVGVGPTFAGLALLPFVIGSMVGSVYGGGVVEDTGRYKKLLICANIGTIITAILLWGIVERELWLIPFFLLQFVLAFFLGVSQDIYGIAVQNATSAERQGMTGSGLEFVRLLGSALGLSLVGSLFLISLDRTMPTEIQRWLTPLGIKLSAQDFEDQNKVEQLQNDLHRQLVKEAQQADSGDDDTFRRLASSPLLDKELRKELGPGSASHKPLTEHEQSQLESREKVAVRSLLNAASGAIRKAQGQVYLLTALLALIGLLSSVMQPERKLRVSLDEDPTP